MTRKVIFLLIPIIALQGCAMLSAGRHTLGSLSEIELDMDKKVVEKKLGKPNVVRIGKKLSADHVYELHEYKLYDDTSVRILSCFILFPAELLGTDTYWLHYIDSKLCFWGGEGDWRGAPKWFNPYNKPLEEEQPRTEQNSPKVTGSN